MQNQDYYQELGISKEASEAQIAQAYRILALNWHPKLSKKDPTTTYHKFCRISEAYEVLSDAQIRQVYDRLGEDQLKQGYFENGKLKGGYSFQGDPDKIFEKFFGITDPYAQIYDLETKQPIGSLLGFAFNAEQYALVANPDDLVVTVDCTLNELYNGALKKITYNKTVLNGDGRTTRQVQEKKELEIRPGYNSSNVISFVELGHQAAGVKNSNLIFKIRETAHSKYKRKGNDLVYTARISLIDALCSKPIEIQTLDGRTLFISIDQVISPQTEKIIPSEGLPIFNKEENLVKNFGKAPKRGNLIIKFDIKFPVSVDEDNKDRVIEILESALANEQTEE